MRRVFDQLLRLDRRWIFLLMGIAVLVPTLLPVLLPERPTHLVRSVFDEIEGLPPGARILFSFDYDPSTEAELQPMATALVWHCAKKRHKLYFMALFPLGPEFVNRVTEQVLKGDFPELVYGVDYVNLGYKAGAEGVIKGVASNLPELYTADTAGTSLDAIPLTRDLVSIRAMDLVVSLSAGYPGTKEWIQYATTPLDVRIVSGSTGVQAPQLYPYIPDQLCGLLAAIKGAAEYEQALAHQYPEYARRDGRPRIENLRGTLRMGPQLVGHVVIMALIVVGNIALAVGRRRREVR